MRISLRQMTNFLKRRAILYSVLVRELLELDVVLLHYPGHLATAVCLDTEVSGDYMMIGGRRYTRPDLHQYRYRTGDAAIQTDGGKGY